MKDMINTEITINRKLHQKCYPNGQLAIFVFDHYDEPLAEISIMSNLVELAPDEFILKDYAENKILVQTLFESEMIVPTNRFVLIGSHLCLICRINS